MDVPILVGLEGGNDMEVKELKSLGTKNASCCCQGENCDGELTITIQINGKAVDTMQVPANICNEPLKALALENEKVLELLDGRQEQDVILNGRDSVNIIP